MPTPPSPTVLALAAAQQAQLPECIKYAAAAGLAASGCGLDFECICTNDNYLLTLQGVLAANCTAAETQLTIKLSSELCLAAVPSLNDSLQPMIIAIVSTLMVFSTLSVIARLISRRIKGNKLWWDDYSIIVALIVTYGQNFLSFFAIAIAGYGRHVAALTGEEVTNFSKLYFVTQMVFSCATTAMKLSILLLYYRIFPSTGFKKAFILVGGLNVALWIAQMFSIIFICTPTSYFWDRSIPNGHCFDINTFAYGITGANFGIDLMIWLLPLPWLWTLQMKVSKKLAVIGLFLLGGLVCLAGIIRLPLLFNVKYSDITWTIIEPGVWLIVETNLGIVCACLPIMRPLLVYMFPCANFRSRWTNTRSINTISPFPSARSRQSKYNRSDSQSGSSKGLKDHSAERIIVSHELEMASHKETSPKAKQGWYSVAMPSVVAADDHEKDAA